VQGTGQVLLAVNFAQGAGAARPTLLLTSIAPALARTEARCSALQEMTLLSDVIPASPLRCLSWRAVDDEPGEH
jgi:hypothetical protein